MSLPALYTLAGGAMTGGRARWAALLVSAGALAAGGVTAAGRAPAAAAGRTGAGGWRVALSVSGHHAPYFSAVTATGLASGWAFEGFQFGGTDRAAAFQLTGSGWHKAAFPARPGELVTRAAASSPGNVWALVQDFPGPPATRVLRWDGATWSVARTFRRAAAGLAVLSPRDVWVFGFGYGARSLGARHWNGHRWTAPPSGHGLIAGRGRAADDVWAVGGLLVAHWNGHRWARTSVAALLPRKVLSVHPRLVDIYEQSPSSVWAVGSGYREQGGGPVVVLHYDGHRWSKAAQGGTGNPGQIEPDGSGGLWIPVPTIDGIDGATGRIVHVIGGHLTGAPLPVSPEAISVQSIANAPGTTRSFAAGFTHARFDPISGVRAVLLQIN
jgi:hypothetical protein